MNKMYEQGLARQALCLKLKNMLIEQLGLDILSDYISNDQPLFGRGLELDSIDALDVSVGLYETFGLQIDDDNTAIFSSINTMADFIETAQSEVS